MKTQIYQLRLKKNVSYDKTSSDWILFFWFRETLMARVPNDNHGSYLIILLRKAGLVVLRVAEVAQFQEKILRAILNGDLTDVVVTPQQMWVLVVMNHDFVYRPPNHST